MIDEKLTTPQKILNGG